MGKFCEVCAKGTLNGNNVSHSNRKSHRLWAPNVQSVRVEMDGKVQRMPGNTFSEAANSAVAV